MTGGGPVYVRELVTELGRDPTLRIDIVTRRLEHESPSEEWIQQGRVRVVRLGPALPFSNLFGRLWFLARSFVYLLLTRYDLYNPQSTLPGLPAKLAGAIRGIPVVYTIHGTILFRTGGSLTERLFRAVEHFLCLTIRYDAEISVAQNFLRLPNRNTSVQYIPNSVRLELFDTRVPVKHARFTLLFVGRLESIKCVDDAIAAFARVREHQSFDGVFDIIGTGTKEAQLRRLVAALGLENSVRFLGHRSGSALYGAYVSAHVFVLPSLSEGFPLTLLEAWAARLPAIVTDVGDNRDLITRSQGAGFVCDVHDVATMARHVLFLYTHPDERDAMGKQGYYFVKDRFSWATTAAETLTVFHHAQRQ